MYYDNSSWIYYDLKYGAITTNGLKISIKYDNYVYSIIISNIFPALYPSVTNDSTGIALYIILNILR
jgi:hypothetical protein